MPELTPIPLSEVAEVFLGLARHGKGLSPEQGNPAFKLIGMKALQAHGLDFEAIETVRLAPDFDFSYYQIARHDILLACRATDLRVVLAPPEVAGMLIDANVLAIRCGPQLAPQVLAAYFQHPAGKAVLESASQSTTTQKNLTVKAVKRIALPVPPREAQAQLVQLLEVAELQYQLVLQAAEKRLQVAQQIVVNTLFRGSSNGANAGTFAHD
ncbi:MAG: hypothetical protein AAB354_05705 [candidate division KSB1 bacterium]